MKLIFDKKTQQKPIKSWCENPEKEAIQQAINLSNLPFVYKHIALMPDTHKGYGMPIGCVIGTKGVIIPNAVGVDIGCGVRAEKTNLTEIDTDTLKNIIEKIKTVVPIGFNHRKTPLEWEGFKNAPIDIPVIKEEIDRAKYQLGSLGGGNHFIEIQKGSDGYIWIMLHTGSRNFGYKIAKTYNQKAQELCKQWYSNIPNYTGEDGLAFLPEKSKEGQEYIKAMNFALEFAYYNRICIMSNINNCFPKPFYLLAEYDISHNYASLENHYGENIWIHRKGAILAREDIIGIIPGSQGSKSYITKGLGNKESFYSSSHGAGRAMGRNEAIKQLNLKDEQEKMKGILHSVLESKNLDESVSAYKNIDTVMSEQVDLTKIIVELKPLGVVKG